MFDQTRKFDGNKLRMDLIPPQAISAIAEVLTYGAEKYSPESWRLVEPFYDRYYAAALRHLIAWRSGEKIDPESKISHLKHALCNLVFLVTKEAQDNGYQQLTLDDCSPKYP